MRAVLAVHHNTTCRIDNVGMKVQGVYSPNGSRWDHGGSHRSRSVGGVDIVDGVDGSVLDSLVVDGVGRQNKTRPPNVHHAAEISVCAVKLRGEFHHGNDHCGFR